MGPRSQRRVIENVVADEEAKKAAKLGSSPAKSLLCLLRKVLPLSRPQLKTQKY